MGTVVVVDKGEAVVVDPAFFPDDVRRLADAVVRLAPAGITVALTHGDFDHVCGIGCFGAARVVAAEGTAARLRTEIPSEAQRASVEWACTWPVRTRVDAVIQGGEHTTLGAVRVEPIEAAHHGVDGLVYAFPDHGVVAVGDFCSPVAIPAVLGSLAAMRDSYRSLLARLRRDEPSHVVPAHGPVLSAAQAIEIGAADLVYLDGVARAADRAAARGARPNEVAFAAFGVEPPRPVSPEFGFYSERVATARAAAAEALAAL